MSTLESLRSAGSEDDLRQRYSEALAETNLGEIDKITVFRRAFLDRRKKLKVEGLSEIKAHEKSEALSDSENTDRIQKVSPHLGKENKKWYRWILYPLVAAYIIYRLIYYSSLF